MHENTKSELELPFEIRTDPDRVRSKLLDTVVSHLWYLLLGYVAAVLICAAGY